MAINYIKGLWDYSGVEHMCFSDHDQASYKKAATFLGDTVEDWGCGTGWAERYFKNYKGIDGSASKYLKEEDTVDLRHYTSKVENILLRQTLECCGDWRLVLNNAIRSFEKKLCIVISTPLVEETRIGSSERMRTADNRLASVIEEIFFKKQDLLNFFPESRFKISEETVKTNQGYGEDWILYVEKITR